MRLITRATSASDMAAIDGIDFTNSTIASSSANSSCAGNVTRAQL